jgi:hypothetical protein
VKRSLTNVLTLGSLLLSAFVACGDDDDGGTVADAPAGPPSIRITGFVGADNRVTERDDENTLEVCGSRFGVVIEVTDDTWTFRPPGRCGESAQCGYVAVTLDPESGSPVSQNSINLTTMLDLSGAPVLPSEGGAGGDNAGGGGSPGVDSEVSEGTHRVRVELRNDDGSVFLLEGEPVADEAEVDLSFVPCPSSNGSGSGGVGGQPGAGGSPAGGAGGSVEGGAGGNSGDLGGAGGAGVGGSDAGGAGGAG